MGVDLNVLDVLFYRSSKTRPLRQYQIRDLLLQEHGIEKGRGSLSRDLLELERAGRVIRDNGYYYNFQLDDNELRVVCDSILFAKQLPSDVVRTILRKLVPAASPRRESYLMNVEYLADMNRNENRYLYETLRKIDSAIRNNRHLAITSCGYNIDGKLEEQGEYLFDPYYIVSDKCRYYVLGGCEKHKIQLEPRRVDRIAGVREIRKKRKPLEYYWQGAEPFDIKKYLREHIYMFSGESVRIAMEIKQNRIGDFIDWFGKDFSVIRRSTDRNGLAEISVKANENAVFFWALQYEDIVKILSPDSLVRRIRDKFEHGLKKYMGLC